MASPHEVAAMRRALELASSPGVPAGPNPRVGCVLLSTDGSVIAEGFHRGAGSAHAEADALARAGEGARGATAVVTLEPCDHTGRTPACSQALIDAGVARVVYAVDDPHPVARGGSRSLRAAGIDVEAGCLEGDVTRFLEPWLVSVNRGRPFVTWKVAATLDGRIAASDGSSRWISGEEARAEVHDLRTECDAIMIGTGTALADDPHLTARDRDGQLLGVQPVRVVVGGRTLPADARVLDDVAPTLIIRDKDPNAVVDALAAREFRHVLLEGGPTLATAFLRAGLIDHVVWYVAPLLLGSGRPALDDLGITALDHAVRLRQVRVTQVGEDARIEARIIHEPTAAED